MYRNGPELKASYVTSRRTHRTDSIRAPSDSSPVDVEKPYTSHFWRAGASRSSGVIGKTPQWTSADGLHRTLEDPSAAADWRQLLRGICQLSAHRCSQHWAWVGPGASICQGRSQKFVLGGYKSVCGV